MEDQNETKSNKEEFIEKLESDVSEYDDVLDKSKKIQDNVPYVQARKDEAETLLNIVNLIPDDVFDELLPGTPSFYESGSKYFKEKYSDVIALKPVPNLSSDSTSGTTSITTSIIVRNIKPLFPEEEAQWIPGVMLVVDEYADKRSKEHTIPKLLEQINENLKLEFQKSLTSYKKCRSGNEDLQNTVNQLRSFIQSFWGELAYLARNICDDLDRRIQRFQLKTEKHRKIIAKCLAKNKAENLELHLNNLYSTYTELSSPAKDLNFDNQAKVNDLYIRWLLQIDAILSAIKLNNSDSNDD
ncbi:MAG: hypothetical protein PVF83_13395 [Anaerolineales bacterium]|jgi:cell division septum initiation protein DivIVA